MKLSRQPPAEVCGLCQAIRPLSFASHQPPRPSARRRAVTRTEATAFQSRITTLVQQGASFLAASCLTFSLVASGVQARPEGVNRPELLPSGDFTPVIDVAGFLTDGEEKRICAEVESLEKDKGVKLRVLAQNYPQTPGLAIRDYWSVDDDTVVFVADPSLGGNILNFNVGTNVDILVPSNFWGRLAGKYGSKFYWQDKGEGSAIVNTVSAIDSCFREPPGKLQCSKIQGELGEESSSGGFGKFFFGS